MKVGQYDICQLLPVLEKRQKSSSLSEDAPLPPVKPTPDVFLLGRSLICRGPHSNV